MTDHFTPTSAALVRRRMGTRGGAMSYGCSVAARPPVPAVDGAEGLKFAHIERAPTLAYPETERGGRDPCFSSDRGRSIQGHAGSLVRLCRLYKELREGRVEGG